MNVDRYHFVAEPNDARLLRALADMLEREEATVTIEVEAGVPGDDRLGSNVDILTWFPGAIAETLLWGGQLGSEARSRLHCRLPRIKMHIELAPTRCLRSGETKMASCAAA